MPEKSILIVDDDRNLRHSLALILQRAGYKAEAAAEASEALHLLKTGIFDLTLLDIMVPYNGSILLPRVLQLYPKMAVLVLTAQTSPETPAEAAHQGEHSRLTKPVTPEALIERVKAILHEPPCRQGEQSRSSEQET